MASLTVFQPLLKGSSASYLFFSKLSEKIIFYAIPLVLELEIMLKKSLRSCFVTILKKINSLLRSLLRGVEKQSMIPKIHLLTSSNLIDCFLARKIF